VQIDGTEPYVFHVEDNDGDAYLVVKALTNSGHRMRIGRASEGRDALRVFQEIANGTHERPNLVLLDLKLPFLSGLELMDYIASEPILKGIPIVVFTSSDEQKDIDAAKAAGCDDFYTKPIDFSVFRASLKQICDKYLPEPSLPATSPTHAVS
jgi:CheY-like chemotaxis protein